MKEQKLKDEIENIKNHKEDKYEITESFKLNTLNLLKRELKGFQEGKKQAKQKMKDYVYKYDLARKLDRKQVLEDVKELIKYIFNNYSNESSASIKANLIERINKLEKT